MTKFRIVLPALLGGLVAFGHFGSSLPFVGIFLGVAGWNWSEADLSWVGFVMILAVTGLGFTVGSFADYPEAWS